MFVCVCLCVCERVCVRAIRRNNLDNVGSTERTCDVKIPSRITLCTRTRGLFMLTSERCAEELLLPVA